MAERPRRPRRRRVLVVVVVELVVLAGAVWCVSLLVDHLSTQPPPTTVAPAPPAPADDQAPRTSVAPRHSCAALGNGAVQAVPCDGPHDAVMVEVASPSPSACADAAVTMGADHRRASVASVDGRQVCLVGVAR